MHIPVLQTIICSVPVSRNYQAFGLTFASDVRLPEFNDAPQQADVDVTINRVLDNQMDSFEPGVAQRYISTSANTLIFHVPQIGKFKVANGNSIAYELQEGASEDTLRLYLLGSCIGALFHQRKLLVLHASTVRYQNNAIAFAGGSGIGKSTLAASLHARGYDLLGDDLCVIDERSRVLPAYPQLKLWQDSVEALDVSPSNLRQIRHEVSKFAYPITSHFYTQPLPLGRVYVLYTWNRLDYDLAEVSGVDKFVALRNQTYRSEYLEHKELQHAHHDNCLSIANSVPIKTLTRPDSKFDTESLCDLIDEDLRQLHD